MSEQWGASEHGVWQCAQAHSYVWNSLDSTVVSRRRARVHGWFRDPETPSFLFLTVTECHSWLSTVGDRAFPVAAARTWTKHSAPTCWANTSRPHLLCLFSEVAPRLFSSGVHAHDFYRNFCSACAATSVIFGHFNRSFLLTYMNQSDNGVEQALGSGRPSRSATVSW